MRFCIPLCCKKKSKPDDEESLEQISSHSKSDRGNVSKGGEYHVESSHGTAVASNASTNDAGMAALVVTGAQASAVDGSACGSSHGGAGAAGGD